MKVCLECGESNLDFKTKCEKCGSQFPVRLSSSEHPGMQDNNLSGRTRKCPDCGAINSSHNDYCQKCSASIKDGSTNYINSGTGSSYSRLYRFTPQSKLPFYLYLFSGLSIIGGIILAILSWPKESIYSAYGTYNEISAYFLSILWFSAGIIESVVFAALGRTLSIVMDIASESQVVYGTVQTILKRIEKED